ncbi:hypothetical protein [Rhizobacter sp. Root1221]|uniref:hypothetical protein n=1 Tax=Rhizobacter sp. Root1221 TaxID=1736433 RepID=UPI0006FE2687|nr:hypothetical protein [Rhizobacter sp. Root1221]KQV85457.1 hypothetical protein ASC87_07135 [Rhizobacter sp. Root1221]
MGAVQASPRVAPAPLQAESASVEFGPLKCSVAGFLLKHSEVRISTDGGGHLIVQVLQPGDALPFVAVQHVKADELESLKERAALLRKHSAVLILGSGIGLSTHDGNAVLKLRHVRGIQPVNSGDYFTTLDWKDPS